jgi:fibrillarin-like rRNA methylase
LKQEAAELKLNAMRHIDVCKDARTIFFTACHTLKSAYLHIEKLKTLRDEMRREQQEAGC